MTSQPGSEQAEHTEQWGGIEASEDRRIELSIPARPELWSVVRMAVGSVAAAIGFDFETIADLRLALDELCNACAVGATSSSVLSLICHWDEAGLYVSCSVSFVGSGHNSPTEDDDLPPGLSQHELSDSILAALVDAYGIAGMEHGSRRGWLRKSA